MNINIVFWIVLVIVFSIGIKFFLIGFKNAIDDDGGTKFKNVLGTIGFWIIAVCIISIITNFLVKFI